MENDKCTVIVVYEVMAEDSDKFLTAWEQANAHLTQQDGYISSALHRACSANPDFRFVNVGCWESDDAFRSATQNQAFHQAAGRLEAYPIHAAAYEVIRS
jgi:heme-degrading monooxygenase HmoA